MAARRVYSDRDRATVFALLTGNNGNVKRTARETGIPISTVRFWKQEWAKDGVPKQVQEVLPAVIEDVAEAFERVRNKALLLLEERIEKGEVKDAELVRAATLLTDKLQVMRGSPTSITEQKHTLPSREEMAALMVGLFDKATSDIEIRESEIEEADWEPAVTRREALPSPIE